MRISSLKYYIEEALIGLFRNRLMSLASIITVASCMMIVSISFCIAANIDYILNQIESKTQISAFIEDDLTSIQINALLSKIADIPNISNVKYVSKEEALQELAKNLGEDNAILAGLEKDNPLPRSAVIRIDDPTKHRAVVNQLAELRSDGVFEVRHEIELIDALTAINTGLRIISTIIILGFLIISIILIMNTIKLTVNARRVEINIMKYIGATDWFIRWPFVIEGILIGILGSILPLAFSWVTYANAIDYMMSNYLMLQGSINFRTSGTIFSFLIPFILTLGILIGVIGSMSSIKRHMQV